ncbi:MAG: hypothetical protein J0H71_14090 [Rhizobiales bacterium]|nr:hypothetical protein [Hyphomicrobiales bacterium]
MSLHPACREITGASGTKHAIANDRLTDSRPAMRNGFATRQCDRIPGKGWKAECRQRHERHQLDDDPTHNEFHGTPRHPNFRPDRIRPFGQMANCFCKSALPHTINPGSSRIFPLSVNIIPDPLTDDVAKRIGNPSRRLPVAI